MTLKKEISNQDPIDVSITDELVTSSLSAISLARVTLLIKEHGLMGCVLLLLAYQAGILMKVSQYTGCGA